MAISFLTGESVDGNIALPDNKKNNIRDRF